MENFLPFIFVAVAAFVVWWGFLRPRKSSYFQLMKAKYKNSCLASEGTWTEVSADQEYHCTMTSDNTDFKITKIHDSDSPDPEGREWKKENL